MSPLAIGTLVAIGILIAVVEIVVVMRIARRLVGFSRRVSDPAQLAGLLGVQTREALRQAGLDPNSVRLADLSNSPALKEQVSADMRLALRDAVRGRQAPASGSAERFEHAAPPPIDQPRSEWAELAVVLLLVAALVAIGVYWLVA